MVHVPVASIVTFAPETVQTFDVVELNVTTRPEVAVAVSASGMVESACEPGLVKLIVWLALATVSVNDWVALGRKPLAAPIVTGYVPAAPRSGVPASTPVAGVEVMAVGSATVSESVGMGVPVRVTVNVPATVAVNVTLLALVIAGGTP